MFQNSEMFGNFLDLLSVWVGYENLIENRQQSAENDVAKHNREQSKSLLMDLHAQFDKQNEILEYQNKLLEETIRILKGETKS